MQLSVFDFDRRRAWTHTGRALGGEEGEEERSIGLLSWPGRAAWIKRSAHHDPHRRRSEGGGGVTAAFFAPLALTAVWISICSIPSIVRPFRSPIPSFLLLPSSLQDSPDSWDDSRFLLPCAINDFGDSWCRCSTRGGRGFVSSASSIPLGMKKNFETRGVGSMDGCIYWLNLASSKKNF